jgi:hypothetical protein
LFIDVVAAFASMLKRIIFDINEGDEAWLAKLAVFDWRSTLSEESADVLSGCAWRDLAHYVIEVGSRDRRGPSGMPPPDQRSSSHTCAHARERGGIG